MRKTHAFVADHLGHSRPSKPEPFLLQDGGSMEFVNTYRDKLAQWELDVEVVADGLEMGSYALENRAEFMRRIQRTFEEDEQCRSGNPPVPVDD